MIRALGISIAFGWAIFGAGTFLFLVFISVRAFHHGGLPAFRKIDLGVPGLVLALLMLSICWPWAWMLLNEKLKENQ